jgi:predicted phage-related endonuclease
MSGDQAKIMALWNEKTGKSQSEDLSGVLPVMIGQYTEEFNAAWYEKQTGDLVFDRNVRQRHETISYMAANLDGKCEEGRSIWEAKHVNQNSSFDNVLNRYLPQMHHNASVAGVKRATLSVLIGTMSYQWITIDIDDFYLEVLMSAEDKFWRCVQQDIPPIDIKPIPVTLKFDDMREVDFTGNNSWAALADDYVANESKAKLFEDAKSGLKSMIEADVKKAHGHGVVITRAKNGNLLIKRK